MNTQKHHQIRQDFDSKNLPTSNQMTLTADNKIPIADAVVLTPSQTYDGGVVAAPVLETPGVAKLEIDSPKPLNNTFTPAPKPAVVPIRALSDLGRDPVRLKCQYCQHEGITKTTDEFGTETWIWSIGCFFFGLWPCACLPCCSRTVSVII